ncbi:EAL domain-containing protein [Kineosporia sp. NBRC 101731]|uniref:putative bifunctional diguanylate cyclase/phosphodiesterase n=1 Tax=Kineosporia sp. NBRC 101731 TaxID=3032199 RepID=UPI0024A5DA02|nr:EAL domain-containing protein [Kineosporia sp. NBRC 101731]GLY27442.1 hypothetical protein Kisp02_08070 [Kineosporia sp. NBRC 101731]
MALGVSRNRPVAGYLTAVVTLLCAVLIVLGVMAVRQVGSTQDRLEEIYRNNQLAGQALNEVSLGYEQVLYEVDNLVLADDEEGLDQVLSRIAAANAQIDASWKGFAALPATNLDTDRTLFANALYEYRAVFQRELLPVASDFPSDADTFLELREYLTAPLTRTAQTALRRLHASVDADSEAEMLAARRSYARSRDLTVALTVLAVLMALTLLGVTVRGLLALRRSRRMNLTDPLTGLANRLMLAEVLPRAADRSAESGREVAVMLLDLDGFKQINDTLGHVGGDQVLQHFADVLGESVRSSDTVVRLGGDEFAMIIEGLESATEAVAIAERIRAGLSAPLNVLGRPVQVRTSIGIAVHAFPQGSDSAAEREVLHQADLAMYASKRAGTHSWQLFADGGGLEADEQLVELREDLRRAVADQQIEAYYQPIMDLSSGDLVGLEALIRWRHPTRGMLSPGLFIPIAEETGLIHGLGMSVLEQSCRQVREWRDRIPALSVSVNVSPRQLERPHLVEEILEVLARTDYDPTGLVLEVTETALVKDSAALRQLQELRDTGIRIAVDDFGTGYSSISYLTQLPVDILKLDQSFVAKLNGQPEGSAVAEAVIRLGQALHLDTIAEGIETPYQANELTLLGCQRAQGYYFARPMPAAQASDFILKSVTKAPDRAS